ncbi:hypothetical protein HDV01_006128 [Terramyces sp. JEL0728]|nr:hypothetical protein HDV01_006128 [Terramyces sp. JEL0728]
MDKDGVVSLVQGNNTVEIVVDAPDGSKSKYEINVYRPGDLDISLKEIIVPDSLKLIPSFSPTETEYYVDVPVGVENFECKIIPMNSLSSVEIIANGDENRLFSGDTIFQFKVISESKSKEELYTIVVRKEKTFFRPTIANEYLTCAACCCVLFQPRKPFPCGHTYCQACASIFLKSEYNASNKVEFFCIVCNSKSSDISKTSDSQKEKEIAQCQFNCPFGCSSMLSVKSIISHIQLCELSVFTCSACDALDFCCNQEKHKGSCYYSCLKCNKKISKVEELVHNFNCNLKSEPETSLKMKEINPIELSLVNKSKYRYDIENVLGKVDSSLSSYAKSLSATWESTIRCKGQNFNQPRKEELTEAIQMTATMLSFEREQNNLSNKTPDGKLLLTFGKVLTELDFLQTWFPDFEIAKKIQDENDQAKDSFYQDEIVGLLLQLGISPSANENIKIKAMEGEYHRLKNEGKTNEATEIQELINWKLNSMKKDPVNSYGKEGNNVKFNTLIGDIYGELAKFHPQMHEGVHFALSQVYASSACSILPGCLKSQVVWAVSYILAVDDLQKIEEKKLEAAMCFLEKYWKLLIQNISTPVNNLDRNPLLQEYYGFSKLNIAIFVALSKGFTFTSKIAKGINSLLNLNYVLPSIMNICPKKSQGFQWLAGEYCRVQNEIYELLYFAENDDGKALKLKLQSSLYKIASSLLDSSNINFKYQICQTFLLHNFENLGNLCNLGSCQFQLYEMSNNFEFLTLAEQSFLGALKLEGGGKPDEIKQQSWWLALEKRVTNIKKLNLVRQPPVMKTGKPLKDSKSNQAEEVKGKKAGAIGISKLPLVSKQASTKPISNSTEKSGQNKKTIEPKPQKSGEKKSDSKLVAASSTKAGTRSKPTSNPPNKTLNTDELPSEQIKDTENIPSSSKSIQARVGLAKVYNAMVTHNSAEYENLNQEQQIMLQNAIQFYTEAVELDKSNLDAYIDLGNILIKQKNEIAAVNIFCEFPFQTIPSQDELYLHTEINRLFIKHKQYKNPKLLNSLVLEGKANGIKSLSNYVDAMDAAGESKLLMKLYSMVSGKDEQDSDMINFFKSKFWL